MKIKYSVEQSFGSDFIDQLSISTEQIDEQVQRDIATKLIREIPIESLRELFQFTKRTSVEYSTNSSALNIESSDREYFEHGLKRELIIYKGELTIETNE